MTDEPLRAEIAARLGVPAGQIALARSMSEYIQIMLAETPQLRDAPRQQELTDRFLAPVLPALEILLLKLRAELDPVLRQVPPADGSQPYPLGQCLQISMAVQQRLESLDPAGLCGPAATAHAALRAFVAAGGEVRRAWGDLRGQYFQNALIVGTLYVDVANDTVVPTKPPVEILPFAQADFRPIADYVHFARIAERYWNYRFLPNHVLPELAPYLPLIQITPTGRASLGPLDRYMLGLTLANGFAPSEQALAAPALAPTTFDGLRDALRGGPIPVAASAEEGRQAALACCRTYRADRKTDCAVSFNRVMAAGREVNRQLARLVASRQTA
ncbi:hypothetical protein DJ021_11145 [Phenylobacterium hankyongense]|uniref:Uncharacterized protein n=1 Tax=Phenylobacterium hankyongense TaxID=1813876 RepID=A0A328AYV6_9CAUL|nr:hypothetical protein [Phenylobacterium hankyongense]RAK60322.1 hypothetical protein DJ021_11145 [Phenylobacterium hankyongense]